MPETVFYFDQEERRLKNNLIKGVNRIFILTVAATINLKGEL